MNTLTHPAPRTTAAPGLARRAFSPLHLTTGLLLLAAAVTAAATLDTGVSSVLVFSLLPDAALLGAIGGSQAPGQLPARAVPVYNLLHHPAIPAVLLAAGLVGLLSTYWLVAGLAWAAHIGMDRGVGYGLRTRDGWQRG